MKTKKEKIGSYLVAHGLISVEQYKAILLEQQKMGEKSEPFGRIAVRKGYVSDSAIREAMKHKIKQETNRI